LDALRGRTAASSTTTATIDYKLQIVSLRPDSW
jgi:hypothetical protein